MKIIPKYQRGGGFEQFFTVYQPSVSKPSGMQSGQASEQKSSKTSSKDKGKLTEKDFFTMLKEVNGLPNDMNAIVSNLISTFQMSNLTGINTENLATTYLQSLMQIKVATDNKATYDKAIEQANKNGAMAEPAISLDGNFLAQTNEGKVVKVSPEEYFNNKDSYQILSVSNIANLRKYDPQLAFSNSYVDIINNSIGFEGFQALLKQAIDGLGTSENGRQGLFSYEGQAIKGLELLQTLGQNDKVQALGSVTEEGLYKYEIIDKTQLSQINSLLSYIMSTFPNNAKTWAAFKLNTSDKDKATRDLILNYLLSKSSNSHDFKISYDKNIEQLTGDSNKKDKKVQDDIPQNTATKWLRGLGVQDILTIDTANGYPIQVLSNTLPLTNSDKKYLGANSVLQQATSGEYASILDFNSASMGMTKIDPLNFGKVVLTDGKISQIDFPSKVLEDGTIVPDLSPEITDAKKVADSEIRHLEIDLSNPSDIVKNYRTINWIYVKHKLKPAYNDDGTPTREWAKFGVINASASNHTLGMGQFDNNELLQTIQDDSIRDALLEITKEEFDKSKYPLPGVDHFYRGTVWIPVKTSYIAAQANTSMKTSELEYIIEAENRLAASRQLTKEKK